MPPSYGIGRVTDAAGLTRLREAVRRVRVEASLVAYITAIVRATRSAPVLTLGASPRGSVALLKIAQAAALLEGRTYAVPDDVKELAPAVLRHRVSVAPELELEGVTADTALRLSRALGTSAQLWLNLQNRYDMETAERALGPKLARIARVTGKAAA